MYYELYRIADVKPIPDIKTAWLINHINHIYGKRRKKR